MRYAIIENGVVTNIAEAEPEFAAEMGWIEAGDDINIGMSYDGIAFGAPPLIPPTAENVKAEANRRLALGFDYDFGDARGIHRIGTTEADLKGWDEVTKVAQAAINLGAPDSPIGIKTDTGVTQITAFEWQLVLLAAGANRQPIFQASFTLQAMVPVPADYSDDKWWPSA